MAKKKNVSVQTVAEACGVSTATVSRVINNDNKVSGETRLNVLNKMKELGYQLPSPSGGQVEKIGVIVDTQVNEYYQSLIIHLHDALAEKGFRMITASLGYRKDVLPDILKTIYDCNVSGVILVTCDYFSLINLLDPRIPHVWIDCNDSYEDTKDIICQVQSDQYSSGVMAAQELYRKGSTSPIILAGSSVSHRLKERFEGLRNEYLKHGIEITEDRIIKIPRIREVLDESKQTIRYLISTGYEFDGVFAISDWRALGAYLALSELGIKVPEQVHIIGFDGISTAIQTLLNITCIRQDTNGIAQGACELLLRQIQNKPIINKRIILPVSILNGQTC